MEMCQIEGGKHPVRGQGSSAMLNEDTNPTPTCALNTWHFDIEKEYKANRRRCVGRLKISRLCLWSGTHTSVFPPTCHPAAQRCAHCCVLSLRECQILWPYPIIAAIICSTRCTQAAVLTLQQKALGLTLSSNYAFIHAILLCSWRLLYKEQEVHKANNTSIFPIWKHL